MSSRIELRDFCWKMERAKAIIMINRVEGQGLTVAKQTYEKLNDFVEAGMFGIGPNATWAEYNYEIFLYSLKNHGVIGFIHYNEEDEKEKERYKEQRESIKKAREWVKTLPEDQQEMVNTLIRSSIVSS